MKNIICFQDVSICFVPFLKYFRDKDRVHGSKFGENSGSSPNDPKGIGICPGTLISHFGVIKTLKTP